ncbi:MAG: WG repeat-containing protein [Paludibacteraceae bacterium]|nr:WG repeat-containing protein [Paludibacteraceae bacterium]
MKKSFLYAGVAMVASLFMMSCENSGGGTTPSPDKSTAQLWPRYDESSRQWGYMDAKGDWAFDARFTAAYEFSSGYALAKTGSVTEFIGTDGNRVSGAPSFDYCTGEFYNGYMRYQSGGYWGLLNNQLKIVIDPYYYALGEMSDNGLISCKKNSSDFYGYIDKNKTQVIDAIYDEANTFTDNVAIVKRGGNYFAINKSAQTVIQPKYPQLKSLGNGRLSFWDNERRKYGLMDTQGKEINSPIYGQINTFTDNGLALVTIDGKYTYIDKDGKELNLSNGRAVAATDFHEGIAFVKYVDGGDYEAVGTDGARKFSLNKGEAPYGNFRGGLCLVWSHNDQGQYFYRYVTTSGDQVRDWIGDATNGKPITSPVATPGVTPTTPTDPINPSDPTDPTDPTDPYGQATYYIKHPWGGGAWTWQPMQYYGEFTDVGKVYSYIGQWGDNGVNINTTASDNGASWFDLSEVREALTYYGYSIGFIAEFYYYVSAEYPNGNVEVGPAEGGSAPAKKFLKRK